MERQIIRRTTAMTDALVAACAEVGIHADTSRLPTKREPTWSVTRRRKK